MSLRGAEAIGLRTPEFLAGKAHFFIDALPIAGFDAIGIDHGGAFGGRTFKRARGALIFVIIGVDAIATGGLKAQGQDDPTSPRGVWPTPDDADGEIQRPC